MIPCIASTPIYTDDKAIELALKRGISPAQQRHSGWKRLLISRENSVEMSINVGLQDVICHKSSTKTVNNIL